MVEPRGLEPLTPTMPLWIRNLVVQVFTNLDSEWCPIWCPRIAFASLTPRRMARRRPLNQKRLTIVQRESCPPFSLPVSGPGCPVLSHILDGAAGRACSLRWYRPQTTLDGSARSQAPGCAGLIEGHTPRICSTRCRCPQTAIFTLALSRSWQRDGNAWRGPPKMPLLDTPAR